MDEDDGTSMMTVTGRVIIAMCWVVLTLIGIDYPNRHYEIGFRSWS